MPLCGALLVRLLRFSHQNENIYTNGDFRRVSVSIENLSINCVLRLALLLNSVIELVILVVIMLHMHHKMLHKLHYLWQQKLTFTRCLL